MRSTINARPIDRSTNSEPRTNQLLDGLSPEAASAFEAIKQTNHYPAGVIIFTEGDEPQGIYALVHGKAKLILGMDKKRAQIIRMAEAGEVMGLSAAIANEPYEMSVETLSPCRIEFVTCRELLRFLHEQPEVCFRVVQLLGQTLHESYEQFCLFEKTPPVATRLAYVLLNWCAEGQETNEGIRLDIPLTHEGIARMIGTSRETVTRALGKFRDKRILRLEGSTILIRKKAELEKLIKLSSHAFLPN
jgi:CRP/FNR family transcriptional regulator